MLEYVGSLFLCAKPKRTAYRLNLGEPELSRDKVQDPRNDKTYPYELNKGLSAKDEFLS